MTKIIEKIIKIFHRLNLRFFIEKIKIFMEKIIKKIMKKIIKKLPKSLLADF